jgi:hypothetical protein
MASTSMADVRCATEVVSSLLYYLGIVGTTQTFCVDTGVDFGANPVGKLGIFAEPTRKVYTSFWTRVVALIAG